MEKLISTFKQTSINVSLELHNFVNSLSRSPSSLFIGFFWSEPQTSPFYLQSRVFIGAIVARNDHTFFIHFTPYNFQEVKTLALLSG